MDETKNTFHCGPTNPVPLSRMRTELVWHGDCDQYGHRQERLGYHAMSGKGTDSFITMISCLL
jgi:hypothetical protein